MTDANVKTTHHRARRAMESYDRTRRVPTTALQDQARAALTAFLRCLQQNDVQGVEALLADEVRALTDGGGEFQAALRPILGRDKVTRFYLAVAEAGRDLEVVTPMLNGMPAVLVTDLARERTRSAAIRDDAGSGSRWQDLASLRRLCQLQADCAQITDGLSE